MKTETRMGERNSFVINHALRVFFIASVLSSVVTQLNTLVDGIIVSHVVTADAISAVSLATPVFSLVMLLGSVIYTGAGLLIAEALGNQKYKQVNRLFTISVTSIVIINVLLAIVLIACNDAICRLLTDEERLLPLLKSYMPISFVGNLFFLLQMTLAQYVKISGRPALATKCVMVESVGNIVLDLLFVMLFGWGMQGAALASATATVLSMLVFMPYLRREPRPFRFIRVKSRCCADLLGKSMLRGLPTAIGSVMIAALFIGLNELFLKTHGADGMFVLSVCVQTLMLSMLVLSGAGSAITGIGGVLSGEQDMDGINRLLNSIFKVIMVGMAVVSVVVFLFPGMIANLFGATGHLLEFSEKPLRIFSLIFIPIGLVIPLSNLFVLLERNMLASLVNVGLLVCLLPAVWLMATVDPDDIWYAMPCGMWILMGLCIAATFVISSRHKGLHWLFLTNTIPGDSNRAYSVEYNTDSISRCIDGMKDVVSRLEVDEETKRNIGQCLEEVMLNEKEMAAKCEKQGTFDISLADFADRVTITVKDVGKAYNPIMKYSIGGEEDFDETKLSIIIATGLCEDINYQYMNGLNCLYLNFKKNNQLQNS